MNNGRTSKTTVFTLLIVLTGSSAGQTDNDNGERMTEREAKNYDAELADQLGADKYGMRRYVMALLKAGPRRDQSTEDARSLQSAHQANIRRLAEQGKLALAGPFLDDSSVRGIYIFNVETVEEARALTETDPAIQAGRLVMELRPWYGSAALLKVNEIHERIYVKNP